MAATLELPDVPKETLATVAWAASLLSALVRDEKAGRRPERLTEPRLATWQRFRGRLSSSDLVQLLFEDAAVLHRIPFDPATLGGPIHVERIPITVADGWLDRLGNLDLEAPSADYVVEQARLLGLTTRVARSDLHVLKPHQKVLELPGTGGQLAHHLVSTQPALSLKDNFTVACGSWQELTLAGIVALDLGAPDTTFCTRIEVSELRDADHPIRQRSYDFVIGLHPDKGGLFQADDQLALWFPAAKIVLV